METRTRSKSRNETAAIKGSQIGKTNISKTKPTETEENKTESDIAPRKGSRRARKPNETTTPQEVEALSLETHSKSPKTRSKKRKTKSTVETPEIKTLAVEEIDGQTTSEEKKRTSTVEENKSENLTTEDTDGKHLPFEETESHISTLEEKLRTFSAVEEKESKIEGTYTKCSTDEVIVSKVLTVEEHEGISAHLEESKSSTTRETDGTYLTNEETDIQTHFEEFPRKALVVERIEIKTNNTEETEKEILNVKEVENNTFSETKLQNSGKEETECLAETIKGTEINSSTNLEREFQTLITEFQNSDALKMEGTATEDNTRLKTSADEEIVFKMSSAVKAKYQATVDKDLENKCSHNLDHNTNIERIEANKGTKLIKSEADCNRIEESANDKSKNTVDNKMSNEMLDNEDKLDLKNKYGKDDLETNEEETLSTVSDEKQEKVFVGLKDPPADFQLLTRLMGPQGQNIEFLQIQTKARVELVGTGSMDPNTEPLHFLVRHSNSGGLQEAVLLVQHLVDTLHQDYEQYCAEKRKKESSLELWMKTDEPEPPGESSICLPTETEIPQGDEEEATGNQMTEVCDVEVKDGKEADIEIVENILRSEKVYVGLDNAPADFGLMDKLLGMSGSNIKYLKTQTDAEVELRGSGNSDPGAEPMHFLVRHKTLEGLQKAVQLIKDLVHTVHQHFQQCWAQMQVSANFFSPVPVPPWPMMMYHQPGPMPCPMPLPGPMPMPGPMSCPMPMPGSMSGHMALHGPMPMHSSLPAPPPTPFRFAPPHQVMEFTSLLQRSTMSSEPLAQLQAAPETQTEQANSSSNQELYDGNIKARSSIAVEKSDQMQLVKRRVQEIQERWKNAEAVNKSIDTSEESKSSGIQDLFTNLKKEAKHQMSTMPPGFLRNQFLKVYQLSDNILLTKDETLKHSQLSSLVNSLKKLLFCQRAERLNSIKPLYLNAQKALTDLSVKLNFPQETITEKKEENKLVCQPPIRDEHAAKFSGNNSGKQKNTLGNLLMQTTNLLGSEKLKSNKNTITECDKKPNKSTHDVLSKTTQEKSKRFSSPHNRGSTEQVHNFQSRFSDRQHNPRRNSFGKLADEKREQHLTTPSRKDSTKRNYQSRFNETNHNSRGNSVRKSSEEQRKSHSTLSANKEDSVKHKSDVQPQIDDRRNKPDEKLSQKPLMEQKQLPMLSEVVMQLHKEVSQFADTLPEGFQKAQLEQILTMLKETPFSLKLTDDQRTELKAILLLLRSTLKTQLLQGERTSLIEQVKLFEESLKCQTDLKTLPQNKDENLVVVLSEDSTSEDKEPKIKKKKNLTKSQKKRIKKLVEAGIPREEARTQVLQQSSSQSSEMLKQRSMSSEPSTNCRAVSERSHQLSYESQEHNQQHSDQQYPSDFEEKEELNAEERNEVNIFNKYGDRYGDDIWMEFSPPPENFDEGNLDSESQERSSNDINMPGNYDSSIHYEKENTLKEDPQTDNEKYDRNLNKESGGPSIFSCQQPRSISEMTSFVRFRDKEVSTIDREDSHLAETYVCRERLPDYSLQIPNREMTNKTASHQDLEEHFQEPNRDFSDERGQYFGFSEDFHRKPKIQFSAADSISRLTFDYKKNITHQWNDTEMCSNRRSTYPDCKRQHENECSSNDFNRKRPKHNLSSTMGHRGFPGEEGFDNHEEEESYSVRNDWFCSLSSNAETPDPEEIGFGTRESFRGGDYFQNRDYNRNKSAMDLFDVASEQSYESEHRHMEREVRPQFKMAKKKKTRVDDIPSKHKTNESFPWSKKQWGYSCKSYEYDELSAKKNKTLNSSSLKETKNSTNHTSKLYWQDHKLYDIPKKRRKMEPSQIKPVNQPKPKLKQRSPSEVVSIRDIDFPRVLLTNEQLGKIKSALLGSKLTSEEESQVPRFNTFSIEAGFLLAICKDRTSADLTKALVPKLKPWENAVLYAVDEACMHEPSLIIVNFPHSSQFSDKNILNLLTKQNNCLNTSEWIVVKRDNYSSLSRLIILVDLETIEKIRQGLNKVFYALGQIKLKLYDPQWVKQLTKAKAQTSCLKHTQISEDIKTDEDIKPFNLEDY